MADKSKCRNLSNRVELTRIRVVRKKQQQQQQKKTKR
jgi:hypothetical protein